jgi:hypothetical protein
VIASQSCVHLPYSHVRAQPRSDSLLTTVSTAGSDGQRGVDGGKDPALEPAVNGYIAFENGVKGFYIGGSKQTPTNIKMEIEVVGSKGRIVVDNAGDGRDAKGEWTGT